MKYTLSIEHPIDIGQLDAEIREVFGDQFIGLNGDEKTLEFIFQPDAKVTEEAVVALLLEHVPRPNTAEAERNAALEALKAFEEFEVTDKNVIATVQGLVQIVGAFKKIYFG